MNAIAQTKRDIVEADKARARIGAAVLKLLTPDDAALLGLPESATAIGSRVVATLRREVEAVQAARERAVARRIPLIGDRFASTLAKTIGAAWPMRKAWLVVERRALEGAYMHGIAATFAVADAHPGSRAGTFIIDLRQPDDFAAAKGEVTPTSILARVKGDPKPS